MLNHYRKLQEAGVLGINRRNLQYIAKWNPRKLYPRCDNKVLTKQLAQDAGISVPELYGCVTKVSDIRNISSLLNTLDSFVIKPARGSGGSGVFVVDKDKDGIMHRANGAIIDYDDLKQHLANTLHGLYSLGGQQDVAMIEERVSFSDCFSRVSWQGLPDVRIIVYRGVPVFAMLRLPTSQSSGRANLHQGAIGVGVDLASGVTHGGVMNSLPTENHPDTGNSVAGIAVPAWEEMLRIAAQCHEIVGLGYLGVDLVVGENQQPMLLEVNVRPGLAIQTANQEGILNRLNKVDDIISELPSLQDKVNYARNGLKR